MLKNIAPKGDSRALGRARRLRRTMSLPEIIVWQSLRKRPAGLKFRRQYPTGPFILDFFCSDARLALEIDGENHSWGDRPDRDAERDLWLQRAGIQTLRIAATDVLSDIDAVIRWIVAEAIARLPLHHSASLSGPPPRAKLGED